jgi:hypothetical protein
MARVTNNRVLMDRPPAEFMQIESNYTNFWILLEDATPKTVTDNRNQRYAKLGDIKRATSHYE